MNLKSEFREALLAGASHEDLVERVLHYKSLGGTQREAYDLLHELWLEFGFDDDESEKLNPQKDELEYMMERIWYGAIWETSLSGS